MVNADELWIWIFMRDGWEVVGLGVYMYFDARELVKGGGAVEFQLLRAMRWFGRRIGLSKNLRLPSLYVETSN